MAAVLSELKSSNNFIKQALEITWLATIILIPLFFNPESNQVFVLNKAALLQFLVITMLAFGWLTGYRTGPVAKSFSGMILRPVHSI